MINIERQQARDQENDNIQSNNGSNYGGNNNLFVSYLPLYTLGYGERVTHAVTAQALEGRRRRASEG